MIVTFYNQRQFVDDALDSVLDQGVDLEIIVTDDGSTDGTRAAIERWRKRHAGIAFSAVYSDQNRGLPAMLNLAAARVRGECFVVLNGDDIMGERRLSAQVRCLQDSADEVGVVYSEIVFADEHGVPTGRVWPDPAGPHPEGDVLAHVVSGTFLGMGNLCVRSSVLDRIGPWNERYHADDFDFMIRTAVAGVRFRYCPAPPLIYRKHGRSMTDEMAPRLAHDRLLALSAVRGRTKVDSLVVRRMSELCLVLARHEGDPRERRRLTRTAFRHDPGRATAKAMLRAVIPRLARR